MRIITGTARGARLKSPKGMDTRPTADRVKESLFNILGKRVLNSLVLDIFAGTGNLGLEALSRGAERAVFIDKATALIIKENALHTHLEDKAVILKGDALRELERLHQRKEHFDLVFCDPPYRLGLWERVLVFMDESDLLNENALLVVEHGTDENELPTLKNLRIIRQQAYGKTTQLTIFQKESQQEAEG